MPETFPQFRRGQSFGQIHCDNDGKKAPDKSHFPVSAVGFAGEYGGAFNCLPLRIWYNGGT